MASHHPYVNENGLMLSPDEVWPWNRAMRLGDGFFETVRTVGGKPLFWEAHYSRIILCAKTLHFDIPTHFTSAFFENCIAETCQHNKINDTGRLRFTFYREGEGTYRPDSNRLCFVLESNALHETIYQSKTEGATVDVFTELRKHVDALSPFKVLGNHVYLQAANWAKRNLLNDALVLNDRGFIIEATSSNLFLVKDGALHTPPVSDGCLGGVMRMNVLNKALALGIPCFESQLVMSDLLGADEIFLTNSIKGITWVRSLREKRYYHKLSDRLTEAINGAVEEYLDKKINTVDSVQ